MGVQVKDVADLDAAHDLEGALAVRAGVSGDNLADVADQLGLKLRQVPAPVDTCEVVTRLVGSADEIAHDCYRAISVDRESCVADRSDVAGAALQYPFDLFVSCEPESADHLLGLDLIQIVVATDEQHHEPPRRFLMGLV